MFCGWSEVEGAIGVLPRAPGLFQEAGDGLPDHLLFLIPFVGAGDGHDVQPHRHPHRPRAQALQTNLRADSLPHLFPALLAHLPHYLPHAVASDQFAPDPEANSEHHGHRLLRPTLGPGRHSQHSYESG